MFNYKCIRFGNLLFRPPIIYQRVSLKVCLIVISVTKQKLEGYEVNKMKKRRIIWGLIILVLVAFGGSILGSYFKGNKTYYKFTDITRGDLENTISSTGTLSPVTTVDVGTQVSGTIARVYVDYNDKVVKNQLLAVLDTFLLKASVLDAEAGVTKAEASLAEAQAEYDRNLSLYEKQLISEADFLPAKYTLKTKEAEMKSAETALVRARRNLGYAYIYSPIDGIVIAKDVEEGQTVAASLSTPTLFQIAQDLSHMEILAAVDESDIGMIEVGQPVRFEVQAYDDKVFEGTVRQIRLQPETVSNVVNYTVVVNAVNDENLLLPGMTATVDFITEQREDVLIVPKSALNFSPSEDEMKVFHERMRKERSGPDMTGGEAATGEERKSPPGQIPEDVGFLWFLDNNGLLAMEPVNIGMSDGINTEITPSRTLTEGMQVITGQTDKDNSDSDSDKKAGNMFPGGPGSRRGGPLRGF